MPKRRPKGDTDVDIDPKYIDIQDTILKASKGEEPKSSEPHTVIHFVENNGEAKPSMVGHMTLSCVVFWVCNPICGAIAFFVAYCGHKSTSAVTARKRGKVSLACNITGVVISSIAILIIILWFFYPPFPQLVYEIIQWISDAINQS